MPHRVRLVHKTLLDGRFHVYTSPDVKGLHITADTKADAQRAAIAMLDALASDQGGEKPVIAFEESAVLEAA